MGAELGSGDGVIAGVGVEVWLGEVVSSIEGGVAEGMVETFGTELAGGGEIIVGIGVERGLILFRVGIGEEVAVVVVEDCSIKFCILAWPSKFSDLVKFSNKNNPDRAIIKKIDEIKRRI